MPTGQQARILAFSISAGHVSRLSIEIKKEVERMTRISIRASRRTSRPVTSVPTEDSRPPPCSRRSWLLSSLDDAMVDSTVVPT